MSRSTWLLASLCIGVLLVSAACGSGAPPTSPSGLTHTPTAPSAPIGPVADIAGSWIGRLESANFPTKTIVLTVVQGGNCVDGAWRSEDGEWSGAISGLTSADAYWGQLSFVRTGDRAGCSGLATIEGPVDGASIQWRSAGLNVRGTCDRDLPQSLTISLRRQ